MSYDQFQQQAYAEGRAVDLGLQAYMRSVFNMMAVGLAATGLMAWTVANVPAISKLIFGTPLSWVAMFAPLAFLWLGFTPARIARSNPGALKNMFFLFAAVMGISMASIFLVFSGESIARAFFVTAGAFAGTALYGYTTKRDLTGMGSFLFMGLIGVFIAGLVNLFLKSSGLQFVLSVAGVIVFTGMTAFDVQRLKETYREGSGLSNDKVAVMGALGLYLNFINLFQIVLSLMGGRRE
jgi:uncharacterized protein